MNFDETPQCPMCEELMYLEHHVEYSPDDEHGSDEYNWECINGCDPEIDTDTEYGEVYLEPIFNNYDSEVL